MNPSAHPKPVIYTLADLYPLFEYMHHQIGLSSKQFKVQDEVARTIWLAMRIDGEIKNGGIEQLFSNLGAGFDPACFIEVLDNINSSGGKQLVQEFIGFIYQSEEHVSSFFGEHSSIDGFNKKVNKLHNELSDAYYKLDPSVETLIVEYAEANWNNPGFQEAIRPVVFGTGTKDETELIGDLNTAVKNGNVATTKKILKKLSNVNQASEYDFVPMFELPYVSSNAKKIELCQLLLDHGADIHFRDKYHNTILHNAAGVDSNVEFITFLLDHGADIEAKDDYDNTPIFSTGTNPENCSLLIERGAKLNIRNKIGFSPLTKMLTNYHGWYENPHAKSYQPKIKKVIDQLLAAGATFHTGILKHGNTELSMFADDEKMLKHLLKQKTIRNAPEFNPDYQKWSAVFEASSKGNLDCLKLLAENGAHLSQELDNFHLETKSFAGSTPLDVAQNDGIREYLQSRNALVGSRRFYSLLLETRGLNEAAVVQLIAETLQVDENESRRLWNTVRKNMGPVYEKIDGNYIRYAPLLIANRETEAEIKQVEAKFRQFNCECILI